MIKRKPLLLLPVLLFLVFFMAGCQPDQTPLIPSTKADDTGSALPSEPTADQTDETATAAETTAAQTEAADTSTEEAEPYTVRLNAHRGYRMAGPDNSYPSFRAAGELGFWAIEADVHETADGYLVCIHDSTIDSTYNGTGAVADMTLEELRTYRIDNPGKGPDLSTFSDEELQIPLFSDYLKICKEYGCLPFIEIKVTLTGDELSAHIQKVIDEAIACGFAEEDILITSINMMHLRAARKLNDRIIVHKCIADVSDIQIMANLNTAEDDEPPKAGIAINVQNLHIKENYDLAEYAVNRARRKGLLVCLRGANDDAQMQAMIDLRLDYIATDTYTPEMIAERFSVD